MTESFHAFFGILFFNTFLLQTPAAKEKDRLQNFPIHTFRGISNRTYKEVFGALSEVCNRQLTC